jgi:hypothetical protein
MIDRQRGRLAPIYGLIYAGAMHFHNRISERYVAIFHCVFGHERICVENLGRHCQAPSGVAAATGRGGSLGVASPSRVRGRYGAPCAPRARQPRNRWGDARVFYFKLKSSAISLTESGWDHGQAQGRPCARVGRSPGGSPGVPKIEQRPQKCGQSPRSRGSGPSPSSPHRSRSRPGRGIVGYRQRFAPRTSS